MRFLLDLQCLRGVQLFFVSDISLCNFLLVSSSASAFSWYSALIIFASLMAFPFDLESAMNKKMSRESMMTPAIKISSGWFVEDASLNDLVLQIWQIHVLP